jgi:hypothetical protein
VERALPGNHQNRRFKKSFFSHFKRRIYHYLLYFFFSLSLQASKGCLFKPYFFSASSITFGARKIKLLLICNFLSWFFSRINLHLLIMQDYYELFGRWVISVFLKRLQLQTWNNLKRTKDINRNISAARGAQIIIKVKWRLKCKSHNAACDRKNGTHSLATPDLRILLHATYTCRDMWKTRYTNLRCHSPFESKFQKA